MAEVVVYARPHNIRVENNGKVEFVPDPNFNPDMAPKIVVPADVAQESHYITLVSADFLESTGAVPPIQVDNAEHKDLEELFKLLQVIRDVLGPFVKDTSRQQPRSGSAGDGDETAKLEKEQDEKILAYINKVVDNGTKKGNMALLFQLLLSANSIEAIRAVRWLSLAVANRIKGKTPDEIREQFAVETTDRN